MLAQVTDVAQYEQVRALVAGTLERYGRLDICVANAGGPPAKPFAEMPEKPEGAEWADPPKVIRKLLYRFDGAGYFKDERIQLFLLPAEGGTARRLTSRLSRR